MNVLQICIAIQIPIAICDFDRHDKLDFFKRFADEWEIIYRMQRGSL